MSKKQSVALITALLILALLAAAIANFSTPTRVDGVAVSNTTTTSHTMTGPNGPVDCAEYIKDVTVPDGTALMSEAVVPKTWRVRNCGTTTWEHYSIVRIYGEGHQPDLHNATIPVSSVPALKPGQAGNVTVSLHVPTAAGDYSTEFELSAMSPQEVKQLGKGTSVKRITRFGDILWVRFSVH